MDKAGARLSGQLEQAGFEAAMCTALAAEQALAADETPVNVLAPGTVPQAAGPEEEDPQDGGKTASGAPHVLVVRTPDERLTWLQALRSRRKEDVTAGVPALFTGFLITDGYKAYQGLLSRLRRRAAVLPARHQEVPRRHETRPRQPAVLAASHADTYCKRKSAQKEVQQRERTITHIYDPRHHELAAELGRSSDAR